MLNKFQCFKERAFVKYYYIFCFLTLHFRPSVIKIYVKKLYLVLLHDKY